ncbi:Alpha-N-acetylgalactosaminide alpha-2,6-sialyltransferase 5 [Galemys pyrenaicus]|uniref:Alpha-N-acetylgalactosaminide alpha-2,6-sialyltransferase 5 n=1 Tax=Galemys pyrenaicus TaxID=202257 RepID=A0A8J5ZNR7_GALPY|nr:Alpha-N-acetylgalactosaminide alpha-2,6-sialyltransferase 5 [Galemys pyrenaicus]
MKHKALGPRVRARPCSRPAALFQWLPVSAHHLPSAERSGRWRPRAGTRREHPLPYSRGQRLLYPNPSRFLQPPDLPSPPDRPIGRAPWGGGGPALSDCPLLSPTAPQRHGLAVCLALTTMCTSLLLVYSSLGGQKERPPQQQQQQAAATGSAQPSVESSPLPRPGAPEGLKPLDGYLGVADHKVTALFPVSL